MKKYNIVQNDLPDIVLASCSSLEKAKEYLKNIKINDKYLQKIYDWKKLPEYKIIENEEEID